LSTQATVESAPIKPQAVVYQLNQHLADDAIVSLDSGTVTQWGARFINATGSQMISVSGSLASMVCALPYAIAAQIAHPGRQCVCVCRGCGFNVTAGELESA